MKVTGLTRSVDALGRFTLPTELRQMMRISVKDPLAIYIDNENIILKKYEPDCLFCGGSEDLSNYKGKEICRACANELKGQYKE